MSIINNNERERMKPFFFALSSRNNVTTAFIIASMVLSGGGLAPLNTTSIIALAQENNTTTASETTTTTTNTIDGNADIDANGSTVGGGGGGNTITSPTSASSGIQVSQQIVYKELSSEVGETPINQTHLQVTFSGNGTLNLPNSTETIRTTSNGSGIASMIGTFAGEVTLTPEEDASENATATIYEIGRLNTQDGTGKGIAIAVFHTNSTGKLASLDGMILIGLDEFLPDGNAFITFWEW
jgi:hypothetical protein